MSTRNRAFQPTTNSTQDLVIGLMKVSLQENPELPGGTDYDHQSAAAYNAAETPLVSLGALQNASVSMTPTFKEHQAGYPQILDFKIAELLEATISAEVEEINDPGVLGIIDNIITSLETGTPKFYSVEALAEFARGGTLSLFAPYAQLKANLNMNFGDDFSAAPFEFECLTNADYAGGLGNDLLYRTRDNSGQGARDTNNQPITKDVSNLAIGMFQVRVGKPSRRIAGGEEILPARMAVKAGATEQVAISGGTGYTGAVDGAFVVKVTSSVDNNIGLDVYDPGADTTGAASRAVAATVDATPVDLSAVAGEVTFALPSTLAADNTVGDIYVVGVYADAAQANVVTGIDCPYSFLPKANNVGAIQSASLETNPTYKDHYSGYPKVKDLQILESSTVTINTAVEEINAAVGAISKGYAVNLFDMLFDGSVNGSLYNVPVEIVAELVTGGTISFWFPNCQITPQGEFAPNNEWASMPFAFEAQVQGSAVLSGTQRLYRQAFVQNV